MPLPHGDAALVSRSGVGVLVRADAAEVLHALLDRAEPTDPAESVLARAASHAGLDDSVASLLGCADTSRQSASAS
jgi:hypothetical protein